ncbi:hypothetical protein N8E87_05235 [Avibacterium paragallinarum]|uniref:hypothetical protein n=1 Tax=Avibacterium paragallinarum TaxID=728 RepID=UPI0021F71106|nr:hypothetical protein [Avibacterium paragallinarum]UXN35484.1 hypothetical protein N8E86_04595 [Avibacterium paragallinarum]UXN35825.1 hypothetical protein N8E87_06315 [Avibacterium paragallinarum]UXN37860.1 hypothetical protein N8E87_05235 [Avibacterium paragallinarum]
MKKLDQRKIIQIAVGEFTTALCNDGTLWQFNASNQSWTRYPEIPQGITDSEYYQEALDSEIDSLSSKERQMGLNKDEREYLMEALKNLRELRRWMRIL